MIVTRWVNTSSCVITENTPGIQPPSPIPHSPRCIHRLSSEHVDENDKPLDALHNDILFQILRWVNEPSALHAIFACSSRYSSLCDNDELLKLWLLARTSSEALELMTTAVATDRHDQLSLLLIPEIRLKLTNTDLELGLVHAMRIGHHVMMHQLLPYCRFSVNEEDGADLSCLMLRNTLINGFQMLTFKVVGIDDERGTIQFVTINAFLADSGGKTGSIRYFQCHGEYTATRHNLTKGITVLLGAPDSVSRNASVKQICSMNRKIIVTCAIHPV